MRSRNPRPNQLSTHRSASPPYSARRIQKFRETCRARSWRESSHKDRKEPRVRIQIRFSPVKRLQSPSKPIQSPASRKIDSVSLSQSESASLIRTRSLSLKSPTPSLFLKFDLASLPFPQILYVRDLFCFDSGESFPLICVCVCVCFFFFSFQIVLIFF